MDLSRLAPAAGSRRKKKRLGCGESSGHGKTSGRGGKGQTARSGGKIRIGFEGGQMPFNRRIPKFGFTSRAKIMGMNCYQAVNLGEFERFADGSTVDPETLQASGLWPGRRKTAGIKVLASGRSKKQFSKRLALKVHAISAAARAKVESLGGSVEIIESKRMRA